jgi:hypothetical protein
MKRVISVLGAVVLSLLLALPVFAQGGGSSWGGQTVQRGGGHRGEQNVHYGHRGHYRGHHRGHRGHHRGHRGHHRGHRGHGPFGGWEIFFPIPIPVPLATYPTPPAYQQPACAQLQSDYIFAITNVTNRVQQVTTGGNTAYIPQGQTFTFAHPRTRGTTCSPVHYQPPVVYFAQGQSSLAIEGGNWRLRWSRHRSRVVLEIQ